MILVNQYHIVNFLTQELFTTLPKQIVILFIILLGHFYDFFYKDTHSLITVYLLTFWYNKFLFYRHFYKKCFFNTLIWFTIYIWKKKRESKFMCKCKHIKTEYVHAYVLTDLVSVCVYSHSCLHVFLHISLCIVTFTFIPFLHRCFPKMWVHSF